MTSPAHNVAQYLLEGKDPSRDALLTLQGAHTYGELTSAAHDVAGYLLQAGGAKGDRVLLASDNGLFWVAAYLGILRAGMVCVPVPPSISPQDFDHIWQTIEARFAFLQAGFASKHADRMANCQVVTDKPATATKGTAEWVSFEGIRSRACPGDHPVAPTSESALAALMFTSGSTGKPRGVMISHGNIIANTESIVEYLKLTEADRMMTVLPFHYCFGTSLLHTHLRVGGSLVLDQRFMYPEVVLQRMAETECTGFAGVPSHFQILLRNSSLRQKSFPQLRLVQQAGGQLAPVFIRELRQAIPNAGVFIMYGQTEASARLSYLPPEFLETKIGSVGKGIPGVMLRVIGEDGRQVQPGEVGEIVAQGGNIALGYWREPAETAATFRDGSLHTGDLATVDDKGFIYIVDRARDFLKIAGKRVSCSQIEDQLLECADLVEAAVIGIPDEVLGEAVQAFVVPRNGNANSLQESLYQFCRSKMPPQQVPKDIVLVKALPKNSAGKVLKRQLRERSLPKPEPTLCAGR